jgi:hypothetical protein
MIGRAPRSNRQDHAHSKRLRGLTIALSVLMASSILTPLETAEAHTPYPNYARYRWANNRSVTYLIRREFPSGSSAAWYARINAGAQTWNVARQDAEPGMSYAGETTATVTDPMNACAYGWNGVYYRSLSSGIAATNTCKNSGPVDLVIIGFSIVVNSSANYYTGTGTPGASQADLQGAATHEFGHAVGLGHFSDSDPSTCDPSGGRHFDNTMCGTLPTGYITWRTLESHDSHTFQAAYPY